MSDVKRWRMDATAEFGQDAWADPKPDENGAWVRYDEITALRARLDAVEKERDDYVRISANWCSMIHEKFIEQRTRAERAEAALERAAIKARVICDRAGQKDLADTCYSTIRALANEAET